MPLNLEKLNTPGRIRTCDPLVRSQILYPTELQVHISLNFRFCVEYLQIAKGYLL